MRADEILGWVSSKMEQFGSFMELERTAEVERVQSRVWSFQFSTSAPTISTDTTFITTVVATPEYTSAPN